MRRTSLALFLFLSSTVSLSAQISPTPVINNEIRDNSSTKMREVTLERVKRDAKKLSKRDSTAEAESKFSQIKEDFEEIQKLQVKIIEAYTTGKEIDFRKISESAAEINKRSVRLNANLFKVKSDDKKEEKKTKESGIKELIIELDKAIGSFVENPAFKDKKLVDQKDAENSRSDLEKIIEISEALSHEAKQLVL